MRVLFIGGTGNISAECASNLLGAGQEVGIVTRGRNATPCGCRAFVADRRDATRMRDALRDFRPDAVVNFLGYEACDVQLDFELCAGKVGQYIFISSATVYAKPPPRLPITESSPLGNPYWDYAQKKLECERWLLERRRGQSFPVTIVRPSHTYSKRWVPNPVSSSSYTFCARLKQGKPVFVPDDGQNPWTLTAASDFATGLSGLVGNPAAQGEIFHITSDEVLTWNQIVAAIADAVGAKEPRIIQIPADFICKIAPQTTGSLKGDKAHPGVFDNTKIKRFVPSYGCRKPFRIGVRESAEWLTAHPAHQNLKPAVDELCDRVVAAWESSRT